MVMAIVEVVVIMLVMARKATQTRFSCQLVLHQVLHQPVIFRNAVSEVREL